MKSRLNDEQAKLVDRAGELADLFATRAIEHDRENTFPHENYADLRDAGFLRMSVPTELGGGGAGLAEIVPVLERLAMGDGSTALAVTMHISPLGQWGNIWRRTGNPRLAELLTLAARDELVWASVTAELGVVNDMTDARTEAVRVDGGYRLTGRKSFATNTSVATHCSTTARFEGADGGPRLLLCRISLSDPSVTVHQTWDTLGMRATQSNDLELDGVFVPEEDVVHSLPVGHFDARVLETVWAWAMPAFAAVYTGIAAGALSWTVDQVVRRGKHTDPLVQNVIGECEILLESSRALIHRHVDDVRDGVLTGPEVQEGVARCGLVKYVASNNAAAVMRQLVEVIGGASYTRSLPFERMWRDVQAGVFMPMPNATARRLLGASVLGVELAPSIGPDETGHDSRAKS
ncbi:alkylation response protein AidB-like acyl-CoA dehydrogenase [Herbihabitans rhizosphaerae]|uniref:Dibenzothiophene monooxygenase n=1 Tax=Herbihabitans rhizosphaerae TaxID=1872711 RepID=A0A4Q7KZE1_9PSEU|nr:acyl-CoA dehydrogenase family protein [Herbihabitans rhizosphaerae]RZS41072.1 alkylation response protein AidB-like acyl-CoA dehydrogenase [Herbihabitans rhizosphaerae]